MVVRVIRFYWAKRERRRLLRYDVTVFGITEEGHRKPGDLSEEEDSGTQGVAVDGVDIWKNTSGEGGCLVCN